MISWLITILVIWGIVGLIVIPELFDSPKQPFIFWSARRLAWVLTALGPIGWLCGIMMLIITVWEKRRPNKNQNDFPHQRHGF
jgi:hypothetical protein